MPRLRKENLSDTPPATPGIFTTEFWKSAIYATLSVLTGIGVIGPGVPDKYKTVIDSAAFLAGAVTLAAYAISRGKTKAAAVLATAQVNAAKIAKTPSAPVAKRASEKS